MKRYALFLALLFLPAGAHAATLTMSGPGSATAGDTFNIPVLLSTEGGESANAVLATVSYPSQLLTLVAISKAGSIISLWPQEPSKTDGAGQFEGVILNPGWSGTRGTVVTLTFQAKASGSASLTFTDASVLANDGKATPILSSASPKTVTVGEASTPTATPAAVAAPKAPTITSSTHPDETTYYAATHVVLDWTNDQDVTAVRIGYDKNSSGVPTVLYTPAISHKEIDLKDGVWYFHVREKNAGGWGSTATFAIHINTNLPPPAITTTTTTTPAVVQPVPPTPTSSWFDMLRGLIPYVLLVLAGLALLLIGWLLGRRMPQRGSKAGHTRTLLHKEFNELKDAVTEEIESLEKVKSKRSLTLEEERLINRLRKLLDKSERTLEKEIDSTG